jgi:hypothetical protein
VPTGNPAWTRSVSHEDYGGSVDKQNYQSLGVVNARTDVGAEGFSRQVSDQAAAVRTAEFAVITYLNNDTGTDPPTIESCLLMTGIASASYEGDSPPTGFPSAERNGDGDVTFTFAASYDDEYGVTAEFTPTQCQVSCGGSAFADATYVISGQTVRVRVFDAAGAAETDVRVTLTVW